MYGHSVAHSLGKRLVSAEKGLTIATSGPEIGNPVPPGHNQLVGVTVFTAPLTDLLTTFQVWRFALIEKPQQQVELGAVGQGGPVVLANRVSGVSYQKRAKPD